ncbi:MAG: hypothetical protein ACRDP8_20240 [Actinopolymorphaceae bacterium]
MRLKRAATPVQSSAPPELLDLDAEVWHDRRAYTAYMSARGWLLPTRERMGADSHPRQRRTHAAMAWGTAYGITRADGRSVDLHRLRAMGVYG